MNKPLMSEKASNVLVLCIYAAFLTVALWFHEPWFDEAQSWLIARDEPFLDLCFIQTRYEGHPPFWWLILSVPAKTGMPYEISIKTIEFVFAVLGEYLLIFKSPFPKWLRYTLPFSYFLFFQYGVSARPYSLMALSVFLLASIWETRNEKPFRACAALALLCMTSAYGIIIAGGISIVWIWECLTDKTLLTSRNRLTALSLFLVFALVIILIIRPYPNTYATQNNSFAVSSILLQRLFYAIFCLPSELFATSYASDTDFHYFMPTASQITVMALISTLVWILMLSIVRKSKRTAYLIVPYFLLAGFASIVYMYMHHIGAFFLVFIFAGWISCADGTDFYTIWPKKYVKPMVTAFCCLGIAVNIFWTGISVANDIRYDFSAGRLLRDYVESNELSSYNWISTWTIKFDEDEKEVLYEDTHQIIRAVAEANPYFVKPLLGDSLSGKSYVYHKTPSEEEMQKEITQISNDPPDFIIGLPNKAFYEHTGLVNDYVLVKELQYIQAWKDKYPIKSGFIMAKKEIAEKLEVE